MKLPHTKFGLASDPRGAQVTMEYQGRTLLGDVRGVRYHAQLGVFLLNVRHFNGEPWPLEPGSCSVNVLDRTLARADGAS